jgi:hypothetical protein
MADQYSPRRGRRGSSGRGAFVFDDYRENHVIWAGREVALKAFVDQTIGGQQHKFKHAHSSHSEDALTWTCLDSLRQVDQIHRERALRELWALAFDQPNPPSGLAAAQVHIGKSYGGEGEY